MEDTGYTGLMRISEDVAVELGEEQVDLDLSDPTNVETLNLSVSSFVKGRKTVWGI